MNIDKHFLVAISLCSIFICNTHAQKRIYFPYFEIINMDNSGELQYSTSKLLKTYIEEYHDYTVFLPKKENDIYEPEDFLVSIENAKKYEAELLLLGEINNIGSVAILTLNLYEVSTGNRIWRDLIKSFPLDDFDPVLSRLGRNFNTNIAAKDDIEIDDITLYEEEKEMRLITVQANNFTGILLGGNYLWGQAFTPRFGVTYSYDVSSVILVIDFEYSSNNFFQFLSTDYPDPVFLKVRSGGMGMGVIFPFYKRKNSFYAHGALEFSATNLKRDEPYIKETEGGLGIYAGLGHLMARTSTANIRYEVGFTYPTYKVNNLNIYELKFAIITSFAASGKK